MADFIPQAAKARKDPLGPTTLNQLHANVEMVEPLTRYEHFSTGKHNALEVPWVLGHVNNATTGYLFDTAYGGGTIARPAAGEATISVASGVIGSVTGVTGTSVSQAAVLANVGDADIINRPYTCTAEVVSATSIKVRTRRFISTLGVPGNSWDSVAVAFDVAVHAKKQALSASTLNSRLTHVRRDRLTEQATDWNALVKNQAATRAILSPEHTAAGAHNVDRIAKASVWVTVTAGPSLSMAASHGVDSVKRDSLGVATVTLSASLSSTSLAACFVQAQPSSAAELVVVNGYCSAVNTFKFYTYVYAVAENIWSRADRPFFATMFGRPA